MRLTASNVALFLLCTFFVCAYLKLLGEGQASPLQLTFAAWGEEATRNFLSRRSGSPIHLYAVITAAAPMDYVLRRASPSWPLFGVGPCDKRRTRLTEIGGCISLHAHACYRFGASGKLDLHTMAACYEVLQVSAGEARDHAHLCHKDAELAWPGVASCITIQQRRFEQRNQSFDGPVILNNCAKRFGVLRELHEALDRFI